MASAALPEPSWTSKSYLQATEEAAAQVEARVEASQVAAEHISKMAMSFALRDAPQSNAAAAGQEVRSAIVVRPAALRRAG